MAMLQEVTSPSMYGRFTTPRGETSSGKSAVAGGRGMDQGFKPSEGNLLVTFSMGRLLTAGAGMGGGSSGAEGMPSFTLTSTISAYKPWLEKSCNSSGFIS